MFDWGIIGRNVVALATLVAVIIALLFSFLLGLYLIQTGKTIAVGLVGAMEDTKDPGGGTTSGGTTSGGTTSGGTTESTGNQQESNGTTGDEQRENNAALVLLQDESDTEPDGNQQNPPAQDPGDDNEGAGSGNDSGVSDAFGAAWLAVAVAFIASVAPLVVWGLAITRGAAAPGGGNGNGDNGNGDNGNGDNGNEAKDKGTTTSFVAREPSVTVAAVVAGLQALLLIGEPGGVSNGTITAIVAGSTAFAGLFLRGLVRPSNK